MSNAPAKQVSVKQFFEQDTIKKKFNELLGKRSASFITSVLQITASNELLKNADPITVYQAAAVSATLDLPLNNNLGFAYIVPFKNTKLNKTEAQFQLGYRGYIQLAMRSGQFKTISVSPIYEGQLIEENPLIGFEFDFKKKASDKIIGYAAYFKLINGFEKTLYSSIEEVTAHAKKYSQTFKKGFGLWKDDFNAMACKTVLKMLLSKYAPLSVEMQTAVTSDSAVIREDGQVDYVDNSNEFATYEDVAEEKETDRIKLFIQEAKTLEQLQEAEPFIDGDLELIKLFDDKKSELNAS